MERMPLIKSVCRNVAHQVAPADERLPSNPFTFYEGQWAYCPAGTKSDHEWESSDGVPYSDLVKQSESLRR